MATSDDHFMDRSLNAIAFWSELTLFDGALDENVVSLFKRRRHA
jgi:hypothetical protein